MKKIRKSLKKRTTLREIIGRLLLDLGKLIFASIFLGSSLRREVPEDILTIIGFATAVVFFFIGVFLEKKEKDRGNGNYRQQVGKAKKEKEMELKDLNTADITLIVMMATGVMFAIIGLVSYWRERGK